jgi:4-hydroxyphenylpyruvate dioxygenase-like putative hemolysin
MHIGQGSKGKPSGTTSVRHIDHVTYVAAAENEEKFIATWAKLGFSEHVRVFTLKHPAAHIALVSGMSEEYPWATMTGLSVSQDKNSAINEFVKRYGPGVQHVAYNIDPEFSMEQVHAEMQETGWKFMTPVLTYQDGNGARLRQFFAAPTIPFGPFVEFVQRLTGQDGKAFDGFDQQNIDDLYDHYLDYSRRLERRK